MENASTIPATGLRTDTIPPKSSAAEEIQQIPADQLHPFEEHPFQVRDDDAMNDMVESIKLIGVTTPILARPLDSGGYEIISGHRRLRAAQLLGLEQLPVIVRNIDRDEAIVQMVDSNLQRDQILPSERAMAYKMKMEALRRRAGRPLRQQENSPQVAANYRADDEVGKDVGMSGDTVRRFVRLTNLIPELMEKVDSKEIAFNPAVELSYLSEDEQRDFLSAMDYAQTTPSLSQAQRIKHLHKEGKCTSDAMERVMNEEKKEDVWRISFTSKQLSKYFPKSYTPKQMEAAIYKLLEANLRKRQRAMER